MRYARCLLWIEAAAALAIWATLLGCQPFDHYREPLEMPPVPAMEPPRELSKVALPAYRIEPPDLLQIDVLKLVPRPPYHIEVYDVLQLQVLGGMPDLPIDGFYLVESEGTVNLGAGYGTVRVVGMTIDEATAVIGDKLRSLGFVEPDVSVVLARTGGTQPISGTYFVGPDGTINLRQYGAVLVAGKTLTEARVAIERQLSEFFDSPEVSVDMAGYNSKVYYIITEGANIGDSVVRVPVTGNETVLDGISQVGGLSQLSSTEIWVARPAPGSFGCEQIMPVDWEAISRGGSVATNYQLMPGDRLYIAEDKLVSTNNLLAKLVAPVERLLGVTGLGGNTVRNLQTLGRNYNRQRNS